MIFNYIKSALRTIFANKLFSTIHILGLSIGLAACFVMLLIVIHEYSYDKHNDKLDNIYRVYTYSPASDMNFYGLPIPLNNYIKENIPEVEKSARAYRGSISAFLPNEESEFEETKAYYVDEELLDILTIPILKRTGNELLSNPNSILISRSVSEKYFKGKNPLGQVITVKPYFPKDERNFIVTGVFEDFPFTSTFKADYLLPMKYGEQLLLQRYSFRANFTTQSWLMVTNLEILLLKNANATAEQINSKLPKYSDFVDDPRNEYNYKMHSYSSVHLNAKYANWNPYSVDETTIKLFTGIAILILVIACLNFIIMSTSKFNIKSKDVGIRKVLGAGRSNITAHILIESVLYSLLSFPVTIILIRLIHNNIAAYLNIELADNYYFSLGLILIFIVLTIAVGLISGLYSVFKLSNLSPLQTISYKKSIRKNQLKSTPILLILQMTVFIALVFSSFIIKQQIDYFTETQLGFNKNNLLIIGVVDLTSTKYKSLKEKLKNSPLIRNVTGASILPPSLGGALLNVQRKDEPSTIISTHSIAMDFNFFQTLEIPLKEGRYFSEEFITDSVSSVIINETAAQAINVGIGDMIMERQVVGIVKDFKYGSLRENIPPILMNIEKTKYINEIAIKYQANSETETIDHIQNVWNEFTSDQPLEFYYMDEKFDDVYKSDYNFASLINVSSLLAVLIACLGLFGFTVFNIEQRIKEVGIRRVLGASTFDILFLFIRKFLLVIILSSVIGLALGSYFTREWLSNFVYRIDITLLDYIVIVAVCTIIIVTTVSLYIVKTIFSNPAESLKYE